MLTNDLLSVINVNKPFCCDIDFYIYGHEIIENKLEIVNRSDSCAYDTGVIRPPALQPSFERQVQYST